MPAIYTAKGKCQMHELLFATLINPQREWNDLIPYLNFIYMCRQNMTTVKPLKDHLCVTS